MPMLGETGYTTPPVTVDLNTVGDTFVPVPFNYFIARAMTVYGASSTMAASAATIGAYTAASAGGTAIVTPATATGLTAATKFTDRTIAASADYLQPTQYTDPISGQKRSGIFIRVGVANGSALTCKVQFNLDCVNNG